MSVPYTHADHMRRCAEAAQQGHVLARQHVQVMKRGILYCAQLCSAWTTPDGADCWTVETTYPEQARFTVPVKQVRLCGDARCICVDAQDAPCAAQAERAAQGVSGVSEGVRCL